jgi:hypothetical protein
MKKEYNIDKIYWGSINNNYNIVNTHNIIDVYITYCSQDITRNINDNFFGIRLIKK